MCPASGSEAVGLAEVVRGRPHDLRMRGDEGRQTRVRGEVVAVGQQRRLALQHFADRRRVVLQQLVELIADFVGRSVAAAGATDSLCRRGARAPGQPWHAGHTPATARRTGTDAAKQAR